MDDGINIWLMVMICLVAVGYSYWFTKLLDDLINSKDS